MILVVMQSKTKVEADRSAPAVSPCCSFNIEVEDSLRTKYACGGINYHQWKRDLYRINRYKPRIDTNLLYQCRPHILLHKKQWGLP